MHPFHAILLRASAFAALCASFAAAKTFEGFNLSAGLVGGVNNPYAWIAENMGHGYLFLGPSVNLFENRLTLQADFGLSDQAFFSTKSDWDYIDYEPGRDTLFRYRTNRAYAEDVYQSYWSYKASLNSGSWSFFAGELIQFRIYDESVTRTVETEYSTPDDLNSFRYLEVNPVSYRYAWGSGMVFPIYGAARRFGRLSVWVQGVSLISLQAGVGISLRPLGPIGPHR